MYTNPTNPYYDPVWSQSYGRRSEEPIREGDHTMHYAPGYDRNFFQSYGYGEFGDPGYYEGGGGGMMGGGGGDGYGRMMGPGRRMYAMPVDEPSKNNKGVLNGNSFMR